MPDQALHTLEEYPTFIPLITTDSASSRSKAITSSSDESIQSDFLSPFTAAATTDAAAAATTDQINQSNVHRDDLVIPVHQEQRPVQNDRVLKQGLVLCTRTAQWYTRKKSTTRELQLRKTRLRWRQFKAVLRADKIELFHVTVCTDNVALNRELKNAIIQTTFLHTQRIAHVIYLNNKYPYRRVRLSLVSAHDYIWCLEFVHHQTKSIVSFHFQSASLSEAQDWYMALYHTLPALPACKKPIPAFVDIQVMIDTPMQVRLPLDYVLKHTKQEDTLLNIHIQDIKPVIRSLLQKDELLHTADWLRNDFRLCWRPMDVSNKRTSTVITSGDRIEWLPENTVLIGPQLIEQVRYRHGCLHT